MLDSGGSHVAAEEAATSMEAGQQAFLDVPLESAAAAAHADVLVARLSRAERPAEALAQTFEQLLSKVHSTLSRVLHRNNDSRLYWWTVVACKSQELNVLRL